MKSRRFTGPVRPLLPSQDYLLRLRCCLPCHKLPSLRSLGPDIEEFEPEAARLAVNLSFDRRPACDERGIADHAHLTVGKASALILGLARSHRFEPARLGIGDGGGVGIEKLVVCKRLHGLPVPSDHRRKALVFQGENFLFAAHSIPPLGCHTIKTGNYDPRNGTRRQMVRCRNSELPLSELGHLRKSPSGPWGASAAPYTAVLRLHQLLSLQGQPAGAPAGPEQLSRALHLSPQG